MKSLKEETRKMRAEWALAVREGRVVRYYDGHMVAYPTIAIRDREMALRSGTDRPIAENPVIVVDPKTQEKR